MKALSDADRSYLPLPLTGLVAKLLTSLGMPRDEPWVDLEKIDDLAVDLLRQLEIERGPIDPAMIATRLGYEVRLAAFPDSSMAGQVSNRSGRVVIDVSGFDPMVRQRFTIAHEIGHARLHLLDGARDFVDTESTLYRLDVPMSNRRIDRREMAANRFAAALLMPAPWVREALASGLDVSTLAKRFGVSVSALRNRLNSLGLAST